jgi:hypothetical protein
MKHIFAGLKFSGHGILRLDESGYILENIIHQIKLFLKYGANMNLEKVKEIINSAEVVEELVILSKKIFGKSSEDARNVVEMFITKSYLMGKKNMIKTIDD